MSASVGVVGCGHWGQNLVRNFSELGALSFVCDSDTKRAIELAKNYNVGHLSFRELCAKENLDAIIVATPASSHFSTAMEVLLSGKHVFVEKPLAMTENEADEMVSCANSLGLHIMVTTLCCSIRPFWRLKKRLRTTSWEK